MKRKLYVELNRGMFNRKATYIEITKSNNLRRKLKRLDEQIDRLQKQREALWKTCDHKVFFDKSGWEYDGRACNGCGAALGFI